MGKQRGFDIALWNRVNKRDKGRCQNPLCFYRGKKTNQHHMHDWSTYPEQRFDEDNLITLCSKRSSFLFIERTGCHGKFHKWMGGYRISCTKNDLNVWFVVDGLKKVIYSSILLLALIMVYFYE